VKYDVGQPLGGWSLFASAATRQSQLHLSRLSAFVQQRPGAVQTAVVQQERLAQRSLGTASSTTHTLNGVYRPLRANGTLGAPITSIKLRNGEGAILIRDTSS
jgi:hypothetical protein